jgi:CheY-like chemotaxis protein
MLVDLLKPLGFETREAADGQAALQVLEAARADIVLIDMAMPVLNGFDTIRRLRAMPGWERTPVVGVSANASDADRAQCMAAGATGFLSKPIDRDALLGLMAEHLGLEWVLQAPPAAGSGAVLADLVVPPPGDLEALHRLALSGNMRAIREHAAEVAARSPALRPFCEKLQQLASAYQSKAILGLLKACLEKSGAA